MINLFLRCRRTIAVASLLVMILAGFTLPTALYAQSTSAITSPATGGSVGGAVPVIGTAEIDNFQRYELYYKQEPSSDDAYIYFDGDTRQVQSGQLGVWQTGDLPPGTYTIRMRVVKADGNYSEHFVRNLSINQQPQATETPTPTPTSDQPTATPIPINTPTPVGGAVATVVQPTPVVVQVEQPDLSTPGAASSPTPTTALVALGNPPEAASTAPGAETPAANIANNPAASVVVAESGNNFTQELGAALALDRLRELFFTGVRYSATIIILIAAIFGGKRLLEWILSRAG